MFSCETKFSCDFCGITYTSKASNMTDCFSKDAWRTVKRKQGWKIVYGNYDICQNCVAYYGLKDIREILTERKSDE